MISESSHFISISHLSKKFFPNLLALQDLNFEISNGEFIAILGPSGCGKSTFLRLVAGLERPTHGEVTGTPEQIAYVFQEAHLMPWRSILENVALPLELQGIDRTERIHRAREALKLVDLAEFAAAYPAQLSGGMKMRASLARAMVTHPKILLLDEPFAALDEITRHNLEEDLRKLWLSKKMTVIFVTHSISEACFLADRILMLSSRPGKIIGDLKINLPEKRDTEVRLSPAYADSQKNVREILFKGMNASQNRRGLA